MAFVVRKVTNKRKFDKYIPENSFVANGEIQADAVTDLKTSNNTLSIYIAQDESAIERIAIALASTREIINFFDYVVLEQEVFDKLQEDVGLTLEDKKRGETPDKLVNSWHKDLNYLTDKKIVELARTIINMGDKTRIPAKDIQELIIKGVDSRILDRSKVNAKLLETLGLSIGLEN